MDIDTSDNQARVLAEKRKSIEQESASLEAEKGRAARAHQQAIAQQREKQEQDIVQISKAAESQMESAKKLNSERVRALSDNTQKSFEALAATTADQIRDLNNNALKAVENKRQSTMENLKFVENQKEDPFYHIKSLNPILGESEKEYTVKVALPEHEAKNLLVSGEGMSLKVTLARRFQENVKNPESGSNTKTNSYQSVVEQLAIPGPYDARKISRDYADGVVTIRLPKPAPASTA